MVIRYYLFGIKNLLIFFLDLERSVQALVRVDMRRADTGFVSDGISQSRFAAANIW